MGGYIGLCLGYSFLQIPDLILMIVRKLKKYYAELRHRQGAVSVTGPLPLRIDVQEKQSNNGPDTRENIPELDIYDVVHSLQIEQNKMTEKMDELTERMNQWEREISTQPDPVDGSRM